MIDFSKYSKPKLVNPGVNDDEKITHVLLSGQWREIINACLCYGFDQVNNKWDEITKNLELLSLPIPELTREIMANITPTDSRFPKP